LLRLRLHANLRHASRFDLPLRPRLSCPNLLRTPKVHSLRSRLSDLWLPLYLRRLLPRLWYRRPDHSYRFSAATAAAGRFSAAASMALALRQNAARAKEDGQNHCQNGKNCF
jgi:hypothetical protein